MTDKELLKKIIENFENDNIDFENAKKEIELITNKEINEYTLRNYYSWTNLENFCDLLAEKPIENWGEINDERAKKLISELLSEDLPENIFDKNTEALEKRYGKIGTTKRTEFEIKAKAFAIGEVIKEERHLAKLTQEQLAEKTGTKKSFISRIENGHSDIQLSTLYRLLENGLGRKISLTIS